MSYIVISDFRFGLDKRRLDLANRPGALSDLVNAHITNGGEIEKRKAFTRTAIPTTVASFGLEATVDFLYIFGYQADPGGWPSNVKYQQLVNPYDTVNAMAKVRHSTVFGGKTFVIAEYADGTVMAFYDGVAVADLYAGVIFGTPSNTNIALLITLTINSLAQGYTASQQVFPNNNKVTVYGPPGGAYSVTLFRVSTSGTLTEQKVADTIPGTIAQTANGLLKVNAGSVSAGVNKVSQIAVGATNLLTAAVDFTSSTADTVVALAVAVNNNSTTSGYRAAAEGSLLRIFATTSGATPNGSAVVVTAAGDVCVGFCAISFAGTGFNLNYINLNGINILTGIKLFPAFGGQTLSAYVESIAADIRSGVGTHGYVAKALGIVLYMSKAVTSSADASLSVDVEVIPTAGNSGLVFLGSNDPALVSASRYTVFFANLSSGSAYWLSDQVTLSVKGGIPPYTFQWPTIQEVPELSGQTRIVRLIPQQPFSATCQYQLYASTVGTRPMPFVPSGTVKLKCLFTDATGTELESPEITFVMPGSGS